MVYMSLRMRVYINHIVTCDVCITALQASAQSDENCVKVSTVGEIISASLSIRIAEQGANVIDHVVPSVGHSVRTCGLWQNG